MNELQAAIYNKFNASTTHGCYTNVGGRFYLHKAPQNSSFPFIVYFPVTDMDEVDFSDEREDFLIQFSIFSENNSPYEAGTILGNLKSFFDDCTLTVTGYNHLRFSRTMTIPNNDITVVPPVFGYSVDYEVTIEKSK